MRSSTIWLISMLSIMISNVNATTTCSAGLQLVDTTCQVCPYNMFSNAASGCEFCPDGLEPLGYYKFLGAVEISSSTCVANNKRPIQSSEECSAYAQSISVSFLETTDSSPKGCTINSDRSSVKWNGNTDGGSVCTTSDNCVCTDLSSRCKSCRNNKVSNSDTSHVCGSCTYGHGFDSSLEDVEVITTGFCGNTNKRVIQSEDECRLYAENAGKTFTVLTVSPSAPHGCYIYNQDGNPYNGHVFWKGSDNDLVCTNTRQCVCVNPNQRCKSCKNSQVSNSGTSNLCVDCVASTGVSNYGNFSQITLQSSDTCTTIDTRTLQSEEECRMYATFETRTFTVLNPSESAPHGCYIYNEAGNQYDGHVFWKGGDNNRDCSGIRTCVCSGKLNTMCAVTCGWNEATIDNVCKTCQVGKGGNNYANFDNVLVIGSGVCSTRTENVRNVANIDECKEYANSRTDVVWKGDTVSSAAPAGCYRYANTEKNTIDVYWRESGINPALCSSTRSCVCMYRNTQCETCDSTKISNSVTNHVCVKCTDGTQPDNYRNYADMLRISTTSCSENNYRSIGTEDECKEYARLTENVNFKISEQINPVAPQGCYVFPQNSGVYWKGSNDNEPCTNSRQCVCARLNSECKSCKDNKISNSATSNVCEWCQDGTFPDNYGNIEGMTLQNQNNCDSIEKRALQNKEECKMYAVDTGRTFTNIGASPSAPHGCYIYNQDGNQYDGHVFWKESDNNEACSGSRTCICAPYNVGCSGCTGNTISNSDTEHICKTCTDGTEPNNYDSFTDITIVESGQCPSSGRRIYDMNECRKYEESQYNLVWGGESKDSNAPQGCFVDKTRKVFWKKDNGADCSSDRKCVCSNAKNTVCKHCPGNKVSNSNTSNVCSVCESKTKPDKYGDLTYIAIKESGNCESNYNSRALWSLEECKKYSETQDGLKWEGQSLKWEGAITEHNVPQGCVIIHNSVFWKDYDHKVECSADKKCVCSESTNSVCVSCTSGSELDSGVCNNQCPDGSVARGNTCVACSPTDYSNDSTDGSCKKCPDRKVKVLDGRYCSASTYYMLSAPFKIYGKTDVDINYIETELKKHISDITMMRVYETNHDTNTPLSIANVLPYTHALVNTNISNVDKTTFPENVPTDGRRSSDVSKTCGYIVNVIDTDANTIVNIKNHLDIGLAKCHDKECVLGSGIKVGTESALGSNGMIHVTCIGEECSTESTSIGPIISYISIGIIMTSLLFFVFFKKITG